MADIIGGEPVESFSLFSGNITTTLATSKTGKTSRTSATVISGVLSAPNVIGMTRLEAIDTLLAANYDYMVSYTQIGANSSNNDTVVSQSEEGYISTITVYQYISSPAVEITFTFLNGQTYTATPYTYDPDGSDGKVVGNVPSLADALSGSTIIIPGNTGGLVKTERKSNFVNVGGGVYQRQVPDQLVYPEFYGWSDGNRLYQEGQTYVVPANDVTFTAIWISQTMSPYVSGTTPEEGSIGQTIRINGSGFASVYQVQFWRYKDAEFEIIDDDAIDAVIPPGAIPGRITVRSNNGGLGMLFYFDIV